VGLQILWGVCIPFTPLHWAIWGSMTVAGVGGGKEAGGAADDTRLYRLTFRLTSAFYHAII